jgi:hypothetical protein
VLTFQASFGGWTSGGYHLLNCCISCGTGGIGALAAAVLLPFRFQQAITVKPWLDEPALHSFYLFAGVAYSVDHPE